MDKQTILRGLPRIDDLIALVVNKAGVLPLNSDKYGLPKDLTHTVILKCSRIVLDSLRKDVSSGKITALPTIDAITDMVLAAAKKHNAYSLKPVINATGVILHTNLGRAVLSSEAVANVARVASAYSTLEYDIESGERGSRHTHIEQLICELTGAEAAMTVNNNAAAVMLTLMTMCKGREVVVSRGELVEIGGSFRVPEIMSLSGAILKEVGTTNKTKLKDYEQAIKNPPFMCFNSITGDENNACNNKSFNSITGDENNACNNSYIKNHASDCDIKDARNYGVAKISIEDGCVSCGKKPSVYADCTNINLAGASIGNADVNWAKANPYQHVAALLKVHTSNFKIVGFCESVGIADLKALGEKYNIPVIYDLGSGLMGDGFVDASCTQTSQTKTGQGDNVFDRQNALGENCKQSSLEYLTGESTVINAIKQGADIVCFSGDKLFGGPQAGIIVGKRRYIDALKKNQFARVVRIDKLTLAALEATLKAYADPVKAMQIPTVYNILAPLSVLKSKAEKLKKMLILTKADLKRLEGKPNNYLAISKQELVGAKKISDKSQKDTTKGLTDYTITVKQSSGQVGGGSAPGEDLPSYVVEVYSAVKSAATIEHQLRNADIPVIARINKDKVLLDVRTIFDNQLQAVADTLKNILLN